MRFVLAYLLMLRPIQKHALGGGKQLAGVHVPSELAEGAFPLLPPSTDEAERATLLKQQLAQLVKADPASSARAVQAWVRGETP